MVKCLVQQQKPALTEDCCGINVKEADIKNITLEILHHKGSASDILM